MDIYWRLKEIYISWTVPRKSSCQRWRKGITKGEYLYDAQLKLGYLYKHRVTRSVPKRWFFLIIKRCSSNLQIERDSDKQNEPCLCFQLTARPMRFASHRVHKNAGLTAINVLSIPLVFILRIWVSIISIFSLWISYLFELTFCLEYSFEDWQGGSSSVVPRTLLFIKVMYKGGLNFVVLQNFVKLTELSRLTKFDKIRNMPRRVVL